MTRGLRRPLAALAASLLTTGLLAADLYAPAQAAPGGWQPAGDILSVDSTFTRLGRVAGSPGNAHSGYVAFQTDEGGPLISLFDWSCPAGVTPPTNLDQTPCTWLRERSLSPVSGGDLVYTGPLSVRFAGTYAVEASGPDGPIGTWTTSVAVRYERVGPIARTVEASDTFRTVDLTAPMRIRGHVAGFRFTDPAVVSSVNRYVHTYFSER